MHLCWIGTSLFEILDLPLCSHRPVELLLSYVRNEDNVNFVDVVRRERTFIIIDEKTVIKHKV